MGDILNEIELKNLYKNNMEIVKRLKNMEDAYTKLLGWLETQNGFNREVLASLKTIADLIDVIDKEQK